MIGGGLGVKLKDKLKVIEKLEKPKAVYEHPNTPKHEAATARRLANKIREIYFLYRGRYDRPGSTEGPTR
jgi:hypothetical protein